MIHAFINNTLKKLLIFSLVLSALNEAVAQNEHTGIVYDFINGKPIPNVNISISKSNSGTVTDENGIFKLNINRYPADLRFTHIAYEAHIEKIISSVDDSISIQLIPSSNILDEISITANQDAQVISDEETPSILSFEIFQDKIFWLEYRGSFNGKNLTIINQQSQAKNTIALDTIKHVANLEVSCNDILYLLTRDQAYPILFQENKILLDKPIKISSYHDFIKPCVLRTENDLIYFSETLNGLETSYLRYNFDSNSISNLITISQEKEIEHYKSDLNLIQQSSVATNITSNSTLRNKKIRDLQKKGDFLDMIYYNPKFKNFLFEINHEIILFNHVKASVEIFDNFQLMSSKPLKYMENSKWLEEVLIDDKTKDVYTIMRSSNGINLERINIDTGTSNLVATLDMPIHNYKSVRIHNGDAYFLDYLNQNSKKQVLKKKSISIVGLPSEKP